MALDIRKWVLQNAFLHHGRAQLGAVVGKLLGEDISLKEKIAELKPEIERVILELNEYSFDEIKSELEQNYPELLNLPKKEQHVKELPNVVDGAVVLRFAPSPSGCCILVIVSFLGCRRCTRNGILVSSCYVLRIRIRELVPSSVWMIVKDAQWLTDNGIAG